MFPESNGTKFWSQSFHLQNSGIFADQNRPKGGPHENEFWQFSITKMNITVWAQKADEKNEVICLVSLFVSWVIVLKLPKMVHFLQNCAELSKKSKSIKAIYLYPSERSHHALSENSMFYVSQNIEE